MKRKTNIKHMPGRLFLLAVLFICTAIPPTAYASENIPVTIDIPLTYIISGNDRAAGGDTVTLIPDDPTAPMPEDSSGGRKTIRINREGTYSFGAICYDRPEIWWYKVTREAVPEKGVTKDESVYRVKVVALNDGHGYVQTYLEGCDEKQELVYKDRVAPETGDSEGIIIYALITVAAGCALALQKKMRKKTKNPCNQNEDKYNE